MSLSSLLISAGGHKAIDTELDALFTTKLTVSPSSKPVTTPISIPGSSKGASKKRKAVPDVVALEKPSKRSKPSPSKAGSKRRDQAQKTGGGTPKGSKAPTPGKKAKNSKKASGKGKAKEVKSDLEDENSDLEQAYHKAHVQEAESDEEDAGDVDAPLVHESVKKGKKTSRSGSKVKFVPADETPERRDQRTIFIGNLSVDVAQKRPLLKQLQRHILSQVPAAKIESTRFRSVPFQAPTSRLLDDNAVLEGGKANPKPGTTTTTTKAAGPAKAARTHDLDRTSAWRSRNDTVDDADAQNLTKDEKRYLTPNQKKKIAFINQEFHSSADTVNAYLVFAHPVPVETRPANLPPPPVVMDPYEAARMAVRECDGSLFMDRVIRVDLIGKKRALEQAGSGVVDLDLDLVDADPKSSVFVGNLDFASKEEDLRVFFEGVVSAERGPPPPASEEGAGGAVGVKKPRTWVTRVRIVRDKDTQLGKGFAYVQFADRESVDEVLALEPTKLKFAKRKLRVQRCRTLPGSSTSTRQATASASTKEKDAKKPRPAPVPIVVPKGDPKLGERLAHLPKEARKQYKSADADRVARRLAKKKARMAMVSKGGVEVKGRERERERARKTKVGATGAGRKKASAGGKKGRVRSGKSLAKMNGRKAAGAVDR